MGPFSVRECVERGGADEALSRNYLNFQYAVMDNARHTDMVEYKQLERFMPLRKLRSGSCKVTLNILGYREDAEWVALALEMDLRGYGSTFNEALRDLQDLVEMQIGFALFKGQPEMILRPADPIWFERFAESRKSCLTEMLTASHGHSNYEVAGLPIPPAHVIEALRDKFTQADV